MIKNTKKHITHRNVLSDRPIKIACYIRVSTHHQIDKESLPFQKQELENYCKYVMNTENYIMFIDPGYSGKNTDRPAYRDMIDRIKQGEFTHMLVWKIDRISRNLKDFTEMWDELAECGVQFISKMEQFDTSTAMGQAMLQIILVFAELERKLTAERVYSLMLDRASKGLWNGAPVAIGYEWDDENGKVVINESEAETVRLIYDLYERTGTSVAVAKYLAENNIRTKRGGIWGTKGVWDVLRNPAYIGIYRWNYRSAARGKRKPDEEVISVPDALPAIITEEQWGKVQTMLDKNSNGCVSRGKAYIPLSHLLRCAYCGKYYVGRRSPTPRKDGYCHVSYQCGTYSRNGTCKNPNVQGLTIEPWLLDYIRAYVQAEEHGGDILEEFGHEEVEHIEISGAGNLEISAALTGDGDRHEKEQQMRLKDLNQQKQKTERAIGRLDDAYFFTDDIEMKKSEYIVKRAEMRSRLEKIDHEIKSMHQVNPTPGVDTEEMSRFLILHGLYNAESLNKTYPLLEPRSLFDFFHAVIKEIEVKDGQVQKIIFNSNKGQLTHEFYYR